MKKIKKQINKLIKKIEKCADDFEKITFEYGVTYDRRVDEFEIGELEIRLSRAIEVESDYEGEIAEVYESISNKNELKKELEKIEASYSDEEKRSKKQIVDMPYFLKENDEYWYSYTVQTTELLFDTFKRLKKQAKFLISLLDKNKQTKLKKRVDSIQIEEKVKVVYSKEYIESIHAKKYINVKEFAIIYDRCAETQKNRRGRMQDPLPHIKEGRNILYLVKDVENWLINNS